MPVPTAASSGMSSRRSPSWDEAGEYRTLPAAALELSYRHSIFEERPGCVIVEAVLTLTPGEETAIRAAMEDYMSAAGKSSPWNTAAPAPPLSGR